MLDRAAELIKAQGWASGALGFASPDSPLGVWGAIIKATEELVELLERLNVEKRAKWAFLNVVRTPYNPDPAYRILWWEDPYRRTAEEVVSNPPLQRRQTTEQPSAWVRKPPSPKWFLTDPERSGRLGTHGLTDCHQASIVLFRKPPRWPRSPPPTGRQRAFSAPFGPPNATLNSHKPSSYLYNSPFLGRRSRRDEP